MSWFRPDIPRCLAQGDSAALIKALGYDKDVQIQTAAARALGTLKQGRVFCVLTENHRVVPVSKMYYATLGESAAVDPLGQLLSHPDTPLREAAQRSLEMIALVLFCRHEYQCKSRAVAIMEKYYESEAPELQAWQAVAAGEWEKAASLGAASLVSLLVSMASEKCVSRDGHEIADDEGPWKFTSSPSLRRLVKVVAGLRTEESVYFATDFFRLNGADRYDWNAAMEAFGELGGLPGARTVVWGIKLHGYKGDRKTAEAALVRTGAPAVDLLLAEIPTPESRKQLGRALPANVLGRSGDARAVPALCGLLQADGFDPSVVEALGTLKDPAAVPALLPFLREAEPERREAAAAALRMLDVRAETLPADDDRVLYGLLVGDDSILAGDGAVFGSLKNVFLSEGENPETRVRAAEWMLRADPTAALDALLDFVRCGAGDFQHLVGNHSGYVQLARAGTGGVKNRVIMLVCRAGGKRAAEMIVDGMMGFQYGHRDCNREFRAAAEHVLGAHAPFVLDIWDVDIITVREEVVLEGTFSDTVVDPGEYERRMTERSTSVFQELCNTRTSVADNILNRVAACDHCLDSKARFLLDRLKVAAGEELRRRGGPRYDPAHYLNGL